VYRPVLFAVAARGSGAQLSVPSVYDYEDQPDALNPPLDDISLDRDTQRRQVDVQMEAMMTTFLAAGRPTSPRSHGYSRSRTHAR
jgi:hypothetical protein